MSSLITIRSTKKYLETALDESCGGIWYKLSFPAQGSSMVFYNSPGRDVFLKFARDEIAFRDSVFFTILDVMKKVLLDKNDSLNKNWLQMLNENINILSLESAEKLYHIFIDNFIDYRDELRRQCFLQIINGRRGLNTSALFLEMLELTNALIKVLSTSVSYKSIVVILDDNIIIEKVVNNGI